MHISISGNDPHIDFSLESKEGRIAPEGGRNLKEESSNYVALSTSAPASGKYQLTTNYLSFSEASLPWEWIACQGTTRVNTYNFDNSATSPIIKAKQIQIVAGG